MTNCMNVITNFLTTCFHDSAVSIELRGFGGKFSIHEYEAEYRPSSITELQSLKFTIV